ncbi:MAG: 50S ribosomal protein L24 [Nanoarchaeota archaeon]|nr:50S ribosomal protein L24 [Nanoarchaeota archaeon]
MKKFSTHWTGSKNPGKQRKYSANAPIHIKRKMLSVNLTKNLREKYKTRNIESRKGDSVKIMKGKYKGKTAKINIIKTKSMQIYLDGIQKKKQDGSMVNIPFRASNLQITEIYLDDKRRFKKSKSEIKTENSKKEEKSEVKRELKIKENKK